MGGLPGELETFRHNPGRTPIDVSSWLEALHATYTTAEQRNNHASGSDAAAAEAEITFF